MAEVEEDCSITPETCKTFVRGDNNACQEPSKFRSPHPHERKFCANDFEIGKLLGKGQFGSVYSARLKEFNLTVALKVLIRSEFIERDAARQLRREIVIHAHMRHPHIVRMYNYFHDEEYIYIILEYAAGGALFDELRKRGRFDEKCAAEIIYQTADGLSYCHCKKVIHRDIKLENLLLDANGGIKIADFGLSVHSSSARRSICGTPLYYSPEMIRGCSYDEKVDSWALGVLCYELLAGYAPFASDTDTKIYRRITNIDYSFPFHMSYRARNLITKLLVEQPARRLPVEDVAKHPWITQHVAKK